MLKEPLPLTTGPCTRRKTQLQPLVWLCLALLPSVALSSEPPRLILQITVDALRGDLPGRHLNTMGNGGFRFLIAEGVHYSNANYTHASTETVVGHSSLATGTTPALHGMVGNVWHDRKLKRSVYNVEDDRYRLLGEDAGVDQSTEIDPTQRVARTDGRSPRALLTSTFSDELAYAYNVASKIFAVSVKDRGAIPMAGQTGKAFWFSKSTGDFVTSNYYYDQYPQWVIDWNDANHPAAYSGKSWTLLRPIQDYMFGADDDQPWEEDIAGFGRTFPHAWGTVDDPYFNTKLTLSPAGDQLTLDFAKALLENEQLGQDAIPDYLSISFSSNDYVLHLFGPSSLEAEDVLLQLDRTLADLFSYIDKTVGLEHTLIVLSADHGAPDAAPYLNKHGDRNAHYVDIDDCMQGVETRLGTEEFKGVQGLVGEYAHPYIYLDQAALKQAGLDSAAVSEAVATLVKECPGVSTAITAQDTRYATEHNSLVESRVRHNYNARRSGDVYVVHDSNVYVNHYDGLVVASNHGSPWNYDTFVPIVFVDSGIKAASVSRAVTPYDIAPTLSARLGIKPPSGSVGKPLPEVVE